MSSVRLVRWFFAVVLALAGATAQAAVIGPSLQQHLARAAADERLPVIVSFRGSEPLGAAQLGVLSRIGVAGYHLHRLPIAGVLATPAQVAQLAAEPTIRSVYYNDRLEYENDGATAITGVQRLRDDERVRNAEGLPFTGKGVGVLINDSGIDGTHPDLAYPTHVVQNVYGGINLAAHNPDLESLTGQPHVLPVFYKEDVPNTDFSTSHGTHVAGIVGGSGAASGGKYTGVAPGASLVGYGSGAALFVLDTLGGFDYALLRREQYNLRIVSNSFGSPSQIGMRFDPDDPTNIATKILADLDMVVVFSAGNSGPGEGSITGVFKKAPWVAVAANGTKDGALAHSSSRGEFGYRDTIKIDGETFRLTDRPTVIAPGTDIVSVRATSVDPLPLTDAPLDADLIAPEHLPFYTTKSGTSMAAPHLSGIIALMLEANPALTWREVKQILEETATNVPALDDWEGGAGYVNAHAAVTRALALNREYRSPNKLARRYQASARVRVGSLTNYELFYTPVSVEPAGITNTAEFDVASDVTLVLARTVVSESALFLVLVDPDGVRYASAITLPAIGSFAAVSAPGKPGRWKVQLRGVCGLAAVPVSGCVAGAPVNGYSVPYQANVLVKTLIAEGFDGMDDIAGHPAEAYAKTAIAQRLMDGRAGDVFAPDATLSRIELATYLTYAGGVRQHFRRGAQPRFTDLTLSQLPFAEAATAIGAPLKNADPEALPPLTAGRLFEPRTAVSRLRLAIAMVRALGKQAAAEAHTGEVTAPFEGARYPVIDAAGLPDALKGYVQLAIDEGLIEATFAARRDGTVIARFKPAQPVTRGEYAKTAVQFAVKYVPRFDD